MIPLVLAAVTAAASAYAASQAGKNKSTLTSGTDTSNRGTSNQYTTTDQYGSSSYSPAPGLQPAYSNLYSMLGNISPIAPSYYQGQTYAPMSDATKQGLAQLPGVAEQYSKSAQALVNSTGSMNPYLNTQQANYNTLSSAADVANNPYVQSQLRANEQSVMDTLRNQMLPQLQSSALGVNALGSSRLGLAQGQALGDASKALAQQNAATMLNAYGQGLNAQQYALGQTGNMLGNLQVPGQTLAQAGQLSGIGANTLLNAGQIREGYTQKAIDEDMARWAYSQQAPQMQLQQAQQLASILGNLQFTGSTQNASTSNQYTVGNNTQVGSGTQTSPNPYYQNPVQAGIGGAMAGYGLYDAYQKYKAAQPVNTSYDYPY